MLSLMREGTVPFGADVDTSKLSAYLASVLQNAHARDLKVRAGSVEFKAGLFRLVTSWNVLNQFGTGILTIDPQIRQVKYQLRFRQLVVVVTVQVGIMSLVILRTVGWRLLAMIPIMWLWLVGGNLFIGIARFERFLSSALADAPRVR
jgi:hypothetical protein